MLLKPLFGRIGVDSVGLGRMVLSYPELPADVLSGEQMARKKSVSHIQ